MDLSRSDLNFLEELVLHYNLVSFTAVTCHITTPVYSTAVNQFQ